QRCIVKYGMQGASLERISEEADMGRTILRHYVGNRDDLIIAVTHRFVSGSKARLAAFKTVLPEKNRVRAMLNLLFGGQDTFDRAENLIADALIAEANRLTEVNRLLTDWFDRLVHFVEQELRDECTDAKLSECRAAALGIISTFLVMGSLKPMTDSSKFRRAAKKAAEQLVESLAA
ncbi:MAG: hypothetical protein ACR2RB_19315, partial [Gammaproteobacteria bacterium]